MLSQNSITQAIKYFSKSEKEKRRIRNIPRHQPGKTILLEKKICFTDSISFLHGVTEIFEEECYYFKTENPFPVIIDCGSNIGLSIIYFKTIYPAAKIMGFEADPEIFKILKQNIRSFNFQEVELVNRAIWIADSKINFRKEGGFSGRIPIKGDIHDEMLIDTTKLSPFINKNIDLLKLDIEGAEVEVLYEIEEKLKFVKNIFIEYHSPMNEEQRLHELIQLLNKNRFRYYIKEAYVPRNPFGKITDLDGMDLQLNIYGVKK